MLSQKDIHKRLFSRGSMNRIEKHMAQSGKDTPLLPIIYRENTVHVF